jgi:hypothetical protein
VGYDQADLDSETARKLMVKIDLLYRQIVSDRSQFFAKNLESKTILEKTLYNILIRIQQQLGK